MGRSTLDLSTINQYIDSGKYNLALDEANEQMKDLSDVKENTRLRVIQSKIYRIKGKHQIALELIEKIYNTKDFSLLNDSDQMNVVMEYAYNLWHNNDLINSEEKILQLEEQYDIKTKNNSNIKAEYFHIRGIISARKGNLKEALERFNQALTIASEISNLSQLAALYSNIGTVFYYRNNLEETKKNFAISLKIGFKLKNNHIIGKNYLNLGLVAHSEGRETEAIKYLEKSFDILKEFKDKFYLSEISFVLFNLHISNNDLPNAKLYLKELRTCSKISEEDLLNWRYELARAIFFKNHKRLEDKLKGIEMLKSLIDNESVDYEMSILAMKHYFDYLIDEFQLYGSKDVLSEMQLLLDTLFDNAILYQRTIYILEAFILKSKLAVITGEIDKAVYFLQEAELLCENPKSNMCEIIRQELEFIQNNRSKFTHEPDTTDNIRKKVEMTQINNFVQIILQKIKKY